MMIWFFDLAGMTNHSFIAVCCLSICVFPFDANASSSQEELNKLALTEIMYNPPALGTNLGNTLEFLEMKNFGTNVLDLGGVSFTAGITFGFTNGTFLGPGQFIVLARDATAFASKYPGVAINGVYSGQLDNAGELLTLSYPTNGTNAVVFSVTY